MIKKVLYSLTIDNSLCKIFTILRISKEYAKKTLKKYAYQNILLNFATSQAQLFQSIPIRLNRLDSSKEQKFVPETPKNITKLKYKSILHTSLVGLQLLQCLLSSTTIVHQEPSAFDKIFGWLSFLLLMTTSIVLHITRIDGPTLGIFLNNIIDISKRITNAPGLATYKAKLQLLSVPILLFSGHIFGPILVFGFHWKQPCKASFVGYFLLEECHTSSPEDNLDIITVIRRGVAKSVTFIGNILMWNLGGSCAGFIFTVCFIISPIVQQDIIQFMRKQLLLNNPKVYGSGLSMYRQLQILNTLYNETQKIALGATMVCSALWTSIGLAFVVSSLKGGQRKANGLVFATFGLSCSNCTFALVIVLGVMLAVSIKSERYLKDVSKLELMPLSREKRLGIRRYSKSCAKLKIQFGENNFLENLTPLRCLDWAANIAVQILLVSGSK